MLSKWLYSKYVPMIHVEVNHYGDDPDGSVIISQVRTLGGSVFFRCWVDGRVVTTRRVRVLSSCCVTTRPC